MKSYRNLKLLPDFDHEFGRMLDSAKLTPSQASQRWNIPLEELQNVLAGQPPSKEIEDAIDSTPPLYTGDLYVPEARKHIPFVDNTLEGVVVTHASESDLTRRSLFRRWSKDKGEEIRFHIYDYADTAVARGSTSTIIPERIWEYLVIPQGQEKNLPSGAMNNGHFEQQMTLFIGPVTVYYEGPDKKIEHVHMETGDMEYHVPFVPHTFTKRESQEEGLILATTFRGELGNRDFLAEIKSMSENEYLDKVLEIESKLPQHSSLENAGYTFQKNANTKLVRKGNYVVRTLLNVPEQRETGAVEYSFDKQVARKDLDLKSTAENWGYVFDAPVVLYWGNHQETLAPGSSFFIKGGTPYAIRPLQGNQGRVAVLYVQPGGEDPWNTTALTLRHAGEQGALRIRSNNVRWTN